MNPVKRLRSRYLFGLSGLILVIVAMQLLLQGTISSQTYNGRIINIASSQVGLVNRIAFFTGQMAASLSEQDFNVARQQVGRAVNRMRSQHQVLLKGDPDRGTPKIMTPELQTLYFDPQMGLDAAHHRFLRNAEIIHQSEFGKVVLNTAAYVYVVNVGPYVLDNLLKAAVAEYETYSSAKIQTLRQMEWLAILAAALLVLLEIVLIFIPMEKSIHRLFEAMRKSHKELEKSKIAAETANLTKTNFLLNMSHELRTPLNAIIGFSESLEHGIYGPLKSKRQEGCVRDIRNSGAHLLALVNDILDLSSAEIGNIRLKEEPAIVSELVYGSVAFIAKPACDAGLDLQIKLGQPTMKLCVDVQRVRQVLVNILANAVKFSPEGGGIRIETVLTDDGFGGISISDTGIGMTPDETATSRERFGQIKDAMIKDNAGIGLGLPLAIEYMNAHQGQFLIHSEKGVGTVVTLLFPPARLLDKGARNHQNAA